MGIKNPDTENQKLSASKPKKAKLSEPRNSKKNIKRISRISKKQKEISEKKTKLAVKARQTKWTPVWVVLKKFGMGKRVHPSAITRYKRSWRRTKLHIKPRRQKKSHLG